MAVSIVNINIKSGLYQLTANLRNLKKITIPWSLSIGRVSMVRCRGREENVEGEGRKSRAKLTGLSTAKFM
jgi:hypothetical protein